MSNSIKQITILGSTGSIGINTLDVVNRHPDQFRVFALSAHQNIQLLFEQCRIFQPQYAVIHDAVMAEQLTSQLKANHLNTEVLVGVNGLITIAEHDQADYVVAAIVGAAGLLPTLAAVNKGKRVLLANKESLVMSGHLFIASVEKSGADLLPIDSEHNAIFQCLSDKPTNSEVDMLWLTASGGPFLNYPLTELNSVTPSQACRHPNWNMGRKISVDSATMMNKGLELIEACWLFQVKPEKIRIVIHPQSVVHSMVAYTDGSVLAQLGEPDMRTPIAYALSWPKRIKSGVKRLDITNLSSLSFQEPDLKRFPCLELALQVAEQISTTAPVVLNAANEVTVQAFLDQRIGFCDIAKINRQVLEQANFVIAKDIETVIEQDRYARDLTEQILN